MPFLQVCAFYILETECGLYKHHGMVSGSNPSFVFLLIIKSTVTLDTWNYFCVLTINKYYSTEPTSQGPLCNCLHTRTVATNQTTAGKNCQPKRQCHKIIHVLFSWKKILLSLTFSHRGDPHGLEKSAALAGLGCFGYSGSRRQKKAAEQINSSDLFFTSIFFLAPASTRVSAAMIVSHSRMTGWIGVQDRKDVGSNPGASNFFYQRNMC